MSNREVRHSVDSAVIALVRFVKYPSIQCCVAAGAVAIVPFANCAMQSLDHCLIEVSTSSNPLNHDRKRVFYFVHLQSSVALEVVDVNTEGLTNWVCCRLNQNVMNFLYFLLMFRLTNWNVQQIDLIVENYKRSIDGVDVIDLIALAAVAVAAGQILYPKRYPMNPQKIVAIGMFAAGIGLVLVAVMMKMIKDQMKKLNSKNSVETKETKQ